MRLFIRPRHGRSENLGVYKAEQIKSETPYSFAATIALGIFVLMLTAIYAFAIYKEILDERMHFGSADPHWGAWLLVAGGVYYGVFVAHPGVIFWYRRISEVRHARQERARRRRERHS